MFELILISSYLCLWGLAVFVYFLNRITKIRIRRKIHYLNLPIMYRSIFFSPVKNRQLLLNKTAVDLIKAHFYFGRRDYVIEFINNYLAIQKLISEAPDSLSNLGKRHLKLSQLFIILFNLNVLLLLFLGMLLT